MFIPIYAKLVIQKQPHNLNALHQEKSIFFQSDGKSYHASQCEK